MRARQLIVVTDTFTVRPACYHVRSVVNFFFFAYLENTQSRTLCERESVMIPMIANYGTFPSWDRQGLSKRYVPLSFCAPTAGSRTSETLKEYGGLLQGRCHEKDSSKAGASRGRVEGAAVVQSVSHAPSRFPNHLSPE